MIGEPIWFNLPMPDFIFNVQHAFSKSDVYITGIISDFNYEKTLMIFNKDDELKEFFLTYVRESLEKKGIEVTFKDNRTIWNSYELILPTEKE